MKELDVVKLKSEYKGISAGMIGTIVADYGSSECEVEFINVNGDTIAVVTVPKEELLLIWENEEHLS